MSGEPSTLLLEHHLKALKLPTFLHGLQFILRFNQVSRWKRAHHRHEQRLRQFDHLP